MKILTRIIAMTTVSFAMTLCGCALLPPVPLDDGVTRQIRATIPSEEGSIKYSSIGLWFPNSSEFKISAFNVNPETKMQGIVVVTEKSLLFLQWGGPMGFTILKRQSYSEIEKISLIEFGLAARIAIKNTQGIYDSFCASNSAGDIGFRLGTQGMYETISEARRVASNLMK
jgi:hypothetical protein